MSSAKPPFVLVFDVDGTLIDSRGHLNHSVVELLCLGIIAREHGIVSAILILTNNVFSTNKNGAQGHVIDWLTTTLVPKIIDYIVNHRYVEFGYRKTPSKIFNEASRIISDKYPNKNVKNIMNNNQATKQMFSYKIFDEIFDKRAREVSNISRENKSIHSIRAMLNKARKNVSNVGQRVFFINDDRTHRIKKEIHENQYIHIDPEFSLSQNIKNRMKQGQATQENIHADLKSVSNNINSKPKITELKRILKDKIREQQININNS
jgi:hypothetical protein